MSSFSGSFDPAIALFKQSWTEFSEQSADDVLRLTKSSLTALLGCKLRSVGLASSFLFSLELEDAENAENAFEQLAKCNPLVCQSGNCRWIHVLWDAFKNAWEAERELESLHEFTNDDEFESVSNRAYLTRRDLTSLEGTASELGLLEMVWSGDSCSFLVADPSKLGNELTALPEPIQSSCASTGNKRERAKQRREKAAVAQQQAMATNIPQPAPAMQKAQQAGQHHNQAMPHTTAVAQQQAAATNTPQPAPATQQARQAGQQHKQATPSTTAAAQQQAEATITPQPAAATQQAQQGGQRRDLGERAPPRVEHGSAGSQDRSVWRGGRRRAVCTSGTTTRHDLCRVRSVAVRPRVQHSAAALTCSAHGAWTTMTRDFLARWTIEPD